MNQGTRALLLATLLTACDGGSDVAHLRGELDGVRAELDTLRRAEQASRAHRAGAQQALQPLQDALGQLVQRQQNDVARTASIAAEVQQLATLLQPAAGTPERERLTKLQERLAELERDFAAQKESRAREQQLILRALDATVEKLDLFLQQAAPAPTAATSRPASEPSRSSAWWPVLWLVAGLLAITLALRTALRGHDVAAPSRPAVQPPLWEPPARVEATPGSAAPPPVTPSPDLPLHCRVAIHSTMPASLEKPLRQRLLRDPDVLELPAPEVTAGSDRVDVAFWVPPRAEAAAQRVEADLFCFAAEFARRANARVRDVGAA